MDRLVQSGNAKLRFELNVFGDRGWSGVSRRFSRETVIREDLRNVRELL